MPMRTLLLGDAHEPAQLVTLMKRPLVALILGVLLGGLLSFIAGFFLPIWLMPSSNQGPLTGFIVAPLGALLGGIVGLLVFVYKPSSLRAFRIGSLTGVVFVVACFFGPWIVTRPAELLSGEGLVFVACAVFIFGITGFLVRMACLPIKYKTEEKR